MFGFRYVFELSLLVCGTLCTTWDTTKQEHVKLYDAYTIANSNDSYTDTLPVDPSAKPLEVSLRMEMTSLGGYDAVNGAIDIIGSLTMTWTDNINTLENVGFDSSSVNEILVDYRKLWTPVIVLINSADSITRVGDEAYKVRFNLATGQVTWKPRMIIKASCTPDVSYFPFDQQNCTLTFAPWFVKKDSLKLKVASDTWNMENYDKNGVWEIESTESIAFESGDYYYVSFTVTFNRVPMFFILNLVLPILFLSLLSGFVFLLPAASGERVGFVITCFLTFVILLQTTMTYLPQASAPMSLLSYYVIVMMLFSAFLSLVNALLLRVYHKPKGDEVPRWLVHVMEIIKCIKCRQIKCPKRRNSVDECCASSSAALQNDTEKGLRKRNGMPMPKRDAFNVRRLSKISNLNGTRISDTTDGSWMDKPQKSVENQTKLPNKINGIKATETTKVEVASEAGESPSSESDYSEVDEIDWEEISKVLDTFFLLVFIGVQCGFSIIFLVPIGSRA